MGLFFFQEVSPSLTAIRVNGISDSFNLNVDDGVFNSITTLTTKQASTGTLLQLNSSYGRGMNFNALHSRNSPNRLGFAQLHQGKRRASQQEG